MFAELLYRSFFCLLLKFYCCRCRCFFEKLRFWFANRGLIEIWRRTIIKRQKIKSQECVGKRERWKRRTWRFRRRAWKQTIEEESFRRHCIKQINCTIINWTNCYIFGTKFVYTICIDNNRFLWIDVNC